MTRFDIHAEQVAVSAAFAAVRELCPHLTPVEAATIHGRLVGVICEAISLYVRCREDEQDTVGSSPCSCELLRGPQ